jgi:hypothetical protein
MASAVSNVRVSGVSGLLTHMGVSDAVDTPYEGYYKDHGYPVECTSETSARTYLTSLSSEAVMKIVREHYFKCNSIENYIGACTDECQRQKQVRLVGMDWQNFKDFFGNAYRCMIEFDNTDGFSDMENASRNTDYYHRAHMALFPEDYEEDSEAEAEAEAEVETEAEAPPPQQSKKSKKKQQAASVPDTGDDFTDALREKLDAYLKGLDLGEVPEDKKQRTRVLNAKIFVTVKKSSDMRVLQKTLNKAGSKDFNRHVSTFVNSLINA